MGEILWVILSSIAMGIADCLMPKKVREVANNAGEFWAVVVIFLVVVFLVCVVLAIVAEYIRRGGIW